MADTIKILSFNNEIEATLLSEILTSRGIPFIIRSYHDSAYDGLWQTGSCWGQLDAPEQFKEEIIKIFDEMSMPENQIDPI